MTIEILLSVFLSNAEIKEERQCAALIAYHEARGEPTYQAKTAPVVVAVNRTIHDEFPNSICDVMEQPNQFTFVDKGLHFQTPDNSHEWRVAKQIANDVLSRPIIDDESVGLDGALFFHKTNMTPDWNMKIIEPVKVIHQHIFYRYR